ncbi:MAG: NAD(P)H-hydrate epimerase [Planctomycetota bacterium]|nr:MAG: NAD(P)H-hydrate epimerase [Planctomycetota bacterium]
MTPLDPLRPRSRAEMRELDRLAIERYGIPGLLLMENAGRGAAEIALAMLEGEGAGGSARRPPRGRGVLVFCGRGNNGGDGFVLARHLHNRGYDVRCYLAARRDALPPGSDAATNAEICRRMRIPLLEHDEPADREAMARAIASTELLVDALLGTGARGPVREPYASLIRLLNHRRAPILALDLPSGLDCDTGEILGVAVRAHRTATFGAPKLGFARGRGPDFTGRVDVVDISLPRELLER